MVEKPLLLFPTPTSSDRSKKGRSTPGMHYPDHARQSARLSPIFGTLQQAFETRRVEIQNNITGADPEQVLVIEIIGTVEKFNNAVRKIEGFEWMGETEIEAIEPDDDFYISTDEEKLLNARLFLLMTNQRALNEMISLWTQYIENPNMEFERGLTKFRDIFKYLKDIRRWGVRERLLETGILQNWRDTIEIDPEHPVKFETELWFRNSSEKRDEIQNTVTTLINDLGGQIIQTATIEGIAYHSLLAELPISQIENIISNGNSELVKCDGIMFFRAVGQISSIRQQTEGDTSIQAGAIPPIPNGSPVIALLDGLPLSNHSLLDGRIIIDDPDNFGSGYSASERNHGTAMASLITLGDLNDPFEPITSPLYVRPIMKPNPHDLRTTREELIPNDTLAIDLIHRCIVRIIDGENSEAAVAPNVRVVNISIGDRGRLFDQMMSPFARLLDWLSYKYNILFIISAGNHPDKIELDISTSALSTTSADDIEKKIVLSVLRNARNKRLLSPAESINGLTIGATHFDNSTFVTGSNRLNPYSGILPSPVSALGGGYKRSIKPDLIFSGGRMLYNTPVIAMTRAVLEPTNYLTSPGNKVAASDNAGRLDRTRYCNGTSNSAALISHNSSKCYDTISDIFREESITTTGNQYLAVLIKSMLVHGCRWGEIGERLEACFSAEGFNATQLKIWKSKFIGYGLPEIDRVLECTDQRATVIGFGELTGESAHVYTFPLPPSMSSQRVWRRITVTLSWISPVIPTNQKYRLASLWFELNDPVGTLRFNSDHNAVKRGTVQHEVFEGELATPYLEGASVSIKVNCKEDAGRVNLPIRYSLVVSLETSEATNLPIYEEVKTRIRTLISVRQQS